MQKTYKMTREFIKIVNDAIDGKQAKVTVSIKPATEAKEVLEQYLAAREKGGRPKKFASDKERWAFHNAKRRKKTANENNNLKNNGEIS